MTTRTTMTPEDRKRRLAQRRREWKESDRRFREMVARREQRLREWDEYVARRRAQLRRLTLGLLGRS
jgi:hypothetical protein